MPDARKYVEAGGVIDCRNPANVQVLDPQEQPFESHLNSDVIDVWSSMAAPTKSCVQ